MDRKTELGVIRNPVFGFSDRDVVALHFNVEMLNGGVMFYFWTWDEIKEIITDAKVSDVNYLDGVPCKVSKVGNECKFEGIHK